MFSLQQISDAIRKNGLPQTKGTYFESDEDNNIIAACAMGQAALNLNTSTMEISNSLYRSQSHRSFVCDIHTIHDSSLPEYIGHLNDMHDYTCEQVADFLDGLMKEQNI